MTSTRHLVSVFCLLLPLSSAAHNLILDQRVAPVGIVDKGELNYQQGNFSYQSWNSAQLTGKVRIVQHIAGRSSAQEQNAALIEAIKVADLPQDRYQTSTIINTDDAFPGTGVFVRSSAESNKKQFPWSQFIIDARGAARNAWQLAGGSSAIALLDKDGRVRFVKEGALTSGEVQQVMGLLHELLQ